MRTWKRHRGLPLAILLSGSALMWAGCVEDPVTAPEEVGPARSPWIQDWGAHEKATGEVSFEWNGGGQGAGGDSPGTRMAWAALDIHERETWEDGPEIGSFFYRVVEADTLVHREITVRIDGAIIDVSAQRAWFVGTVTEDTKGCSAREDGGHEDDCPGQGGGVMGPGGGHDGGCDTDDGGGCPDGSHDTGDGGGCPDGSHDTGDGGCSGQDGGSGSGGPGVNGSSCRVGQILVGKLHDGGTPGIENDGITWKWFAADDPDLPGIGSVESWPHLCRKVILEGNLRIHADQSSE